jgi:putative ABC transport system permease protein
VANALDAAIGIERNGDVWAVLLRARRTVRRRWLATTVVAAIVAIVCGAVLALAAGARRTSAAPDAFTDAVGGDPHAIVQQDTFFVPPRTAEVAALPGVESVEAITFAFAALVDPDRELADGTFVFAGTRPYASRLVAGRDPDPETRHEFVADEAFVASHDARIGDRFQLATLTREQIEQEAFGDPPEGPTSEAVLVGVMAAADVFQTEYSSTVFPLALLDEDDVEVASTIMTVGVDPGVTLDQLRAALDSLPDGSTLRLERGQVISADVRNAVGAQAEATWLMAAVAAVAAVVALGQLLTRHVRLADVERSSLRALGFTRGQLAVDTVVRAALPAIAGVAVGMAVAVAASGLFPAGFVRVLEPHPGLQVDVTTLVAGGAVLLAGVLLWVTVAVLATGTIAARRAPSRAVGLVVQRAASPAAATGTRFALTARDGSTAAALGTLLAIAVLIAGVVGSAVFAASHNRLVTDRARVGSNYDFAVGDNTSRSAVELRRALEGDPDIAGLMILTAAQARTGGQTVGLVGVERVQGGLAPLVVAGRLPTGSDEVALGRVAARELDLGLGDEVAFSGPDAGGSYRVVGFAVVPTIGGNDGVGQGGVVTADGLDRLVTEPETSMAAIVLRDDAPADADRRLAGLVGVSAGGAQDLPSSVLNVARVRRIPWLLAVMLAALGTLTIVHALIVSIQHRRRDLAVLRVLGADQRWVGRAVRWQATMLAALPLVVGVPLGVIAGSRTFRAFADRIGALPEPALPIALFVATTIGLVAVANIAALVPARRARRLSTAQTLRDE